MQTKPNQNNCVFNLKKITKQLDKNSKNKEKLILSIKKFARKNNICTDDFTNEMYEEVFLILKSEEIDYATMLKLVERFK